MRTLIIGAIALTFVAGVNADKAETKKKDPLAGVKCPVSGKPVKADKFAAYKGGKVYFCCPGCPAPFAKDTAKFANKANHQLVATGQFVQTKCPIAGRPKNKTKAVKIAGVNVEFCCPNCQGKAKKAKGDAQLALVFGEAPFKKGFAVKKAKK